MSMSTQIYIAHKRKTSNSLYALVRSEHKRGYNYECTPFPSEDPGYAYEFTLPITVDH